MKPEAKKGDYVIVIRPIQRYMHGDNVDYWNNNIGEMFEVYDLFWNNNYLSERDTFNGEHYWAYLLKRLGSNISARFEGEMRLATEEEIDRYFLYKFKDA